MMRADADDTGLHVQLRLGGRERLLVVPRARIDQVRRLVLLVCRTPFTRRTWRELAFSLLSGALTAVAVVFVAAGFGASAFLLVIFLGVVLMAASLRGARGIGAWQRGLARSLIDEEIEEPVPFGAKPGFFGWLQAALRDRAAWRTVAYSLVKIPVVLFGIWFAFGTWWSAFACITYPAWGTGTPNPHVFGVFRSFFPPGFFSVGTSGFFHAAFVVLTGAVLLFVAPWTVRLVVLVDRFLMRSLLAPDAVTARVRSLELSRAQTVDASAATLRRIERDLHDGTQAQLVALAMRLGQAKEKLAAGAEVDLDSVRRLVDEAHAGAKEAIVELRDLARGIHPPVLDVGLEGALATLAARSTVPAQVTVTVHDRPTPAIEAIAYFCVAELLANVAQHARASQATVSCVQHGQWLRIVVRDDGGGGARPSTLGSASSGLSGLGERIGAVDGHLDIVSPPGGPTVVTADLPLHA